MKTKAERNRVLETDGLRVGWDLERSTVTGNAVESQSPEDRPYQVIIVGAGPAGMTSALYSARKGLRTLVLSKDIGGQVNWTTLVENYMGFEKIQGPELMKRFEEQMRGRRLTYLEDEVNSIEVKEDFFVVSGKMTGNHQGRAVIIATGKRPKKLNAPGEDKFQGRGVSYCSTCDAPLFKDASVAVVGGGNSGVQAALDLLAINARKIHLITDQELTADRALVERIEGDQRMNIYLYRNLLEISGERMVTAVRIRNIKNGEEEVLPVEGVFIEIGLNPNSEFLAELGQNEKGELIIDCQCRTNIPGIFAAGDVTYIPEKQIIVAAGEGAKAAIQAWEYLMEQRNNLRLHQSHVLLMK